MADRQNQSKVQRPSRRLVQQRNSQNTASLSPTHRHPHKPCHPERSRGTLRYWSPSTSTIDEPSIPHRHPERSRGTLCSSPPSTIATDRPTAPPLSSRAKSRDLALFVMPDNRAAEVTGKTTGR